MNRIKYSLTIGYFALLSSFLSAYELGAWYKRVPEIPHALNTKFEPSFLILKSGIFSKNGSLKTVGEPKALKKLCDQNYKVTAWITHRLKKTEVLTSQTGENLGINLLKSFSSTCIKIIELDIEPLTGEEIWLTEFLSKLKETVSPTFEIRLAIPALSEKKIVGPTWIKAYAQLLLSKVDGIDIMLYDSGLKSKEEYNALLKYNFETVSEFSKSNPDKFILLGIPAYHDRTALHKDSIENTVAFLSLLKSLSLAETSKICTKHIRLSLYAGWTLSPEDRNTITEIKKHLDEVCKKDK